MEEASSEKILQKYATVHRGFEEVHPLCQFAESTDIPREEMAIQRHSPYQYNLLRRFSGIWQNAKAFAK